MVWLLWLSAFNQHDIFKGHRHRSMHRYFVPFRCPATFHYMDAPNFMYSFFSPWIFGLLLLCGCYAYVAVNIHVHIFVWTCVFIVPVYRHLGAQFLGHMVSLCLMFWGAARLCPKVAAPLHIPTNVWGFQFVHIQHLLLSIFLAGDGRVMEPLLWATVGRLLATLKARAQGRAVWPQEQTETPWGFSDSLSVPPWGSASCCFFPPASLPLQLENWQQGHQKLLATPREAATLVPCFQFHTPREGLLAG